MAERKPDLAVHSNNGLSDRDFLKLLFYGGVSFGALIAEIKIRGLPKILQSFSPEGLKEIENTASYPPELVGVGFNGFDVWTRTPEQIDQFINAVSWAGKIRIGPDNPYYVLEPELGVFNSAAFDKLESFIQRVPEKFTIILPIIDGYWSLRADKADLGYKSDKLCSPYLLDTSSPEGILTSQIGLFTSETCRKAYKRRADEFIKRFGHKPNVRFEIGNEWESPIKGSEGVRMNTLYYMEMFDYVHGQCPRTTLTGVSHPGLIDYSWFRDTTDLVTTGHFYWRKDITYPQPKNVCVLAEELGVAHETFNGIRIDNADDYLTNLSVNTLNDSIVNGIGYVGGVFPYHLDLWHKDNYDLQYPLYRRTMSFLRSLDPYLKHKFSTIED